MSIIKVGEVAYYHELHGDGPPLVLIPGWGADHLTWREVAPRLAEAIEEFSG